MDGNVMSASGWKAGAATVVITPSEPMWLAGWAARREPAKTKSTDLFAKALAIEDEHGERLVIITADLIAIPRGLATAVALRIEAACGLPRARLLFNASHTHTGPEVRPDKVPFFEIPAEYAARIGPYVATLEEKLAGVIRSALANLQPAKLTVCAARANFGMNRRSPGGPSDPDVPILLATRPDGLPLAILFGYACHNLTLPPTLCQYHGDYAGIAMQALEWKYPDAPALFLAGAGADQDPAPRGTFELTEQHGQRLAEAIHQATSQGGRAVRANLHVALEDIVLDLKPLPTAAELESDAKSDDVPRRRKANFLIEALAEKRPLPTTQPCPIQVAMLGDEVLLIALGGEPVIDFALQFKREFAGPVVWVCGYANDMFGYVPTRRVQQEGGYEGGRAALWSAVPMPVADSTEERVVSAVRRMVNVAKQYSLAGAQPSPPWAKPRGGGDASPKNSV